jgi:nucleoid-associated protein YgaU
VAAAPPVARSEPASSGPRAGAGHYTVQQGDTLWAVARHLLGDGASVARVAALVDRIWALNAARIGTGSPDLIRPGEVLRLP